MVEYLTYKDKKYPFRVNYYAIKHYQLETGKELDNVTTDIASTEILLWYALIAGHDFEDKELDLKRENMEFMLDVCLAEFNKLVLNFFPKTKELKEDNKKK